MDERTRTVPCLVIVNDPRQVWDGVDEENRKPARGGPPALVRGMYVDVTVQVKPTSQLLRVPEMALRPGGQVWVASLPRPEHVRGENNDSVSATHVLEFVDVDVVEVEGDEAVVRSESGKLAEGSWVIVSPLAIPASPSGSDEAPHVPIRVNLPKQE